MLLDPLKKNYPLHESVKRVIFVSSHLLYPPGILFISIPPPRRGRNRPAVHYLDADAEHEAAFISRNSATGGLTTGLDSSVPGKNFTNASATLCCYLQFPNAKLAL